MDGQLHHPQRGVHENEPFLFFAVREDGSWCLQSALVAFADVIVMDLNHTPGDCVTDVNTPVGETLAVPATSLTRAAQVKFPPSLAALLVLCTSMVSRSAELKPETLAAWDQYIGTVDARVKTAAAADSAFLWVDKEPGQVQRVQRGEVIVSQIKPQNAQAVPHGLIHDWIGAVFVPDATLADVLAVARDYDQYPDWYGPTITQANLLGRAGDEDRFTIRYVHTALFVTVVLETEYEAHYFQVDATRWYSIARSTRIQEIHEYGKPGERKMPPDDGSGYLWRMYSVLRYEQRDNGIYIERETVGLSRRIPVALRWLVEPAVRRLSRNLLVRFLQQTREAILLKSGGRKVAKLGLADSEVQGMGRVVHE
jgi:hypothetical protein